MNRGLIMGTDGQKMSKSRGNVVDPDEQVERLGADTMRLYLAFIGPYNEAGSYPWDLGGIAGMRRFLEKIIREFEPGFQKAVRKSSNIECSKEQVLHKMIQKISADIEALKFNTAISELMKFVNQSGLHREKKEDTIRVRKIFLILLAPFAPHLADELWNDLRNNTSIHNEKWPSYEEDKIISTEVTIVVQVNGKVRSSITVPRGLEETDVVEQSKKAPGVTQWLEGKSIGKTFYVQDKIVNFVV